MSPRRAGEIAALGLGIAVFGYLGWDGALWDARLQLLLHLAAVAAVAALLGLAWAGGSLPRTRLDVPILVLLVAFGLGALTAWNHGLSARALASILATAAMLPVALLVLRHRAGWAALVVTLPVLALSAGSLAVLGWRRVEWLLAGGPGLPPIRLGGEGTPFGSVAVPPFVILASLPLALLIPQPRLRLGVLLGLAAVGVPLTLLSGSRSAWLAILATAVVLLAPRLSGRLPRIDWRGEWTPRRTALAFGGAVLAILAVVYVAPRLLEAGSLAYRGFLWRDTLAAWSADPLLGIGPGAMPFARQVAAPPLTFPARQPHSHDVPLGILGDAGLVGLVAALVVVVVFVRLAGPWATRTIPGRAAFAVLAGFGVGMLFEDLTFLPNFNLMVILLAGMALTDAGAVAWERPRPDVLGVRGLRAARVTAVMGALALGLVLVLGDGAAIAYREGVEAYNQERWTDAAAHLATSGGLDPWQPTTPKALALAADRSG
ncbi:MAG TPA: O-antigen ligase family protein, partial [Candidatus Limnocylindria bacterium]|nr:O-antigen ligase family protein [Candidatus Limnocylindria bacterium]